MDKSYHTSVMLEEAIEGLNIKPDGFYFDGTLGEGGHSFNIFKRLNKDGLLLSIDQDIEAIEFVKRKYKKELLNGNWKVLNSNFSHINSLVSNTGRRLDGILLDLGISSRQIDIKGKGFSYLNLEDPLDMRMDENLAVKASDLLKVLSSDQLASIFFQFGQERYARRIALEIKKSQIEKVGDLVSLIYKVVPAKALRESNHHPARRVFQALRIAVNDEFGALNKVLNDGYELLNINGRFVVLTFHSLEEKIVRNFFEKKRDTGKFILKGKATSEEEINLNKRSHSAKLTVFEK